MTHCIPIYKVIILFADDILIIRVKGARGKGFSKVYGTY